ncbi:MAG: NAD(P)/FAD-dependent oxidoreductase [Candidatus Syntropharchaeales archaeon]
MYDLVIVGAGPAGLTAAVYAARKRLSCMIVSENLGGQAALSSGIENYIGFQLITGAELIAKFEEHARGVGVELELGERVRGIRKMKDGFEVLTNGNIYQGRALIVASGKVPRKLGVPGEDEYLGRGVTYCATCDGPLFVGKKVAVIGGGNAALDAAIQMTKIAEWVCLVNINPALGGDAVMREQVEKAPNLTIMNSTQTLEIIGETFVKGVRIKAGDEERMLDVEGVFVEIGSIPSSDFIRDLVELNEFGEIRIDRQNRTSKDGIFAAGDVTDVIEKQVIIAAEEGAKALLAADEYLRGR